LALDDLVGPGWMDVLAPVADRISALGDMLRAESAAGRSFAPAGDRVLAALAMPLADVRVLIVGQDPYPTAGHAIGLAFAVARDVRPLPPSLHNILTEYMTDLGLPRPDHGDLSAWVSQGVLLLNRCLTVRVGVPGSHRRRGWEEVTDAIVDGLLARARPLVALLWGRDARALAPRLQAGGAAVIEAPHPSPLSAHRGFLGSRPFSGADEALASLAAIGAMLRSTGQTAIRVSMLQSIERRRPTEVGAIFRPGAACGVASSGRAAGAATGAAGATTGAALGAGEELLAVAE
jgi:uracil-DNA glycosylase